MQIARVTKFHYEKNSFNWIGTKLNLPENFSHEIFVEEIKANYGSWLADPRRQPVIAYSMNARRERVWDTTVPRFVLTPPELGWAIIG